MPVCRSEPADQAAVCVYFLLMEQCPERGGYAGTADARSQALLCVIPDQLQPQPVCGAKAAGTYADQDHGKIQPRLAGYFAECG